MEKNETVEKIRRLLDKPWIELELFNNSVQWHKVYIALDTFDDSEEVIDSYCKLPEFDAYSGGYLYIYGLLQAFMVQQDACLNLCKSLINKDIDMRNEYPDLYSVREIRNNAVGHPTSRGNDSSFHGISRMTLSKDKFTLRSVKMGRQPAATHVEINTSFCIECQRQGTSSILNLIFDSLLMRVQSHMNKFANDLLQDLFKPGLRYLFEKISNYQSTDSVHREIFPILVKVVEQVKGGIIMRFGSIEPDTGAFHAIEKIEYIQDRLKRDLVDRVIEDTIELDIMIQALKREFKCLRDICVDIDEEMNSSNLLD